MITILQIGHCYYLVPNNKVSALVSALTSLTPLERIFDSDAIYKVHEGRRSWEISQEPDSTLAKSEKTIPKKRRLPEVSDHPEKQ